MFPTFYFLLWFLFDSYCFELFQSILDIIILFWNLAQLTLLPLMHSCPECYNPDIVYPRWFDHFQSEHFLVYTPLICPSFQLKIIQTGWNIVERKAEWKQCNGGARYDYPDFLCEVPGNELFVVMVNSGILGLVRWKFHTGGFNSECWEPMAYWSANLTKDHDFNPRTIFYAKISKLLWNVPYIRVTLITMPRDFISY